MTSELEAGKFQRLRAELIEVSTRLLAAALSDPNSTIPVHAEREREATAARYTDLAAKLIESCESEAFAQCGKGPG